MKKIRRVRRNVKLGPPLTKRYLRGYKGDIQTMIEHLLAWDAAVVRMLNSPSLPSQRRPAYEAEARNLEIAVASLRKAQRAMVNLRQKV